MESTSRFKTSVLSYAQEHCPKSYVEFSQKRQPIETIREYFYRICEFDFPTTLKKEQRYLECCFSAREYKLENPKLEKRYIVAFLQEKMKLWMC